MATSVVFDLLDAFLEQLPPLVPTTCQVIEAGDPRGDDSDWLFVGAGDPDNEGLDTAVLATQTPGPFGTNRPRDERGNIMFVVDVTDGDGSMTLARAKVKAITAVVENLCRTNPTLGIGVNVDLGYGAGYELKQNHSTAGARVVFSFSISYWARI